MENKNFILIKKQEFESLCKVIKALKLQIIQLEIITNIIKSQNKK